MRASFVEFKDKIYIYAYASAAGRNEAEGPLGDCFDFVDPDDRFGEKTWELAEAALSRTVFDLCLGRAGIGQDDISFLFSGDLQNQCVASSIGLRGFGIPYLGLYGACSTFGEGIGCAATYLAASPDSKFAAVVTTSHNCASERQFRLPIEYGGQRSPTAQWTATAGGSAVLSRYPPDRERRRAGATHEVVVSGFLPGCIVDGGIADASNMGAAMAPAVIDTLTSYFEARGEKPSDYDAIITGDLGVEGSELLRELANLSGLDLCGRHFDCGKMIYDPARQDVHCGGSGCGCSASVMTAHFLPSMERGERGRVLFLATGALMNPAIIKQKQNIFGIAPLVCLESCGG